MSVTEPANNVLPWFPLYFLGCELVPWLKVMLYGIASRPDFKFLLEFLQWWTVTCKYKPNQSFPLLSWFWSVYFTTVTEKKLEQMELLIYLFLGYHVVKCFALPHSSCHEGLNSLKLGVRINLSSLKLFLSDTVVTKTVKVPNAICLVDLGKYVLLNL